MRMTANQVRWVPVEEIVITQDGCGDALEGAVHVTPLPDGGYRLLSGAKSLAEMVGAGHTCVEVVLNPVERLESRVSALMDELVRGEMHYLDEAERYRELLASGQWSSQQLAARLGCTPATIRRKLRLNNLGQDVARELRESGLCERYAQLLLRVPGQEGRLKMLRHIADGGLSIREAEQLIDELLSRMPVPVASGVRMKPVMRDYRLYVNAIRGIVEQMVDAGLEASMQVSPGRSVAEVRVTIPVLTGRR